MIKQSTIAFLAWKKGAKQSIDIGPMIGFAPCWFGNACKEGRLNKSHYNKLNMLPDADTTRRGDRRMTLLRYGKRISMREFKMEVNSFGLSLGDAKSLIGVAETGSFTPTVCHIKALRYVIEKKTSNKKEAKKTLSAKPEKIIVENKKHGFWARVKFLFSGVHNER